MIKKQTNQELITASLLDLLAVGKSFRSVTIKDITDNCGISRRTFYNSFRDKYDIVLWFYRQTMLSGTDTLSADKTGYYSLLLKSCRNIEENKHCWKKFLKDDTCFEYLQSFTYDQSFQQLIKIKPEISIYEKSLLRFYFTGFLQTIRDWVLHGCQTESTSIAAVLANTLPREFNCISGYNIFLADPNSVTACA